ncbi:hypothetical protein NL346_28670, partial [Klebsiella pneumoniae]|nr:hypothetical protein [Klebsiella pneumoniae]
APPATTRWPVLRYSHGYFGNGLMILSRFPIAREQPALAFENFTRADEVFVRKGAIAVEIEAPGGLRLLVCNSHLGAVSFS